MDDNIIRVIEKVDKADSALTDNSDFTIQFSKQKIFTILPESEILRLYDNVPRLAKAQTLMGNRIVYGNYLEGYDMRNLNGLNVKLGFNATLLQTPLDAETASTQPTFSAPSLHSNRAYEVGIVYMDEYGRSSTALVAPNNKVELECGDSIFQNQIRVTIPSLCWPLRGLGGTSLSSSLTARTTRPSIPIRSGLSLLLLRTPAGCNGRLLFA